MSSRHHRRSINEAGHAHELTFGCYHGFPFLSRERTCRWLADSIEDARKKLDFSLWAYVFMPNHVHLIVHFGWSANYEVAEVLREIKQPVSRKALAFVRAEAPHWLPRLSQRRGQRIEHHFWQRGGGYDRNITEPATLMRMIDYIHLNPVRKQLVERAADWKWSSANWYVNHAPGELTIDAIPPEWLEGT